MKKQNNDLPEIYDIRNCSLGYKCMMDWHSLPNISKSKTGSVIKHCSDCNKNVYQTDTDQELVKNIKLNRCIAILNKYGQMDVGYILPSLAIEKEVK